MPALQLLLRPPDLDNLNCAFGHGHDWWAVRGHSWDLCLPLGSVRLLQSWVALWCPCIALQIFMRKCIWLSQCLGKQLVISWWVAEMPSILSCVRTLHTTKHRLCPIETHMGMNVRATFVFGYTCLESMPPCTLVWMLKVSYAWIKYTELPRHAAVFINELVNALKFWLKCTKSCSPSQKIAGDDKTKTKQKKNPW